MKKYIKVIFGLCIIFILGMVTGAAIMPVIFKDVAGNPYSIDVLAERVYNTNILKNTGLTPDQKEASDELIAKYVLKYTAERDMFMAKRRTLYSEFKYDLSSILTPQQFSIYEGKSDTLMLERDTYSKQMENLWKEERIAKKEARSKKEGVDLKLSYIQVVVPEQNGNTTPVDMPVASGAKLDFLNQYMLDRIKYNWTTYKEYQEIKEINSGIEGDIP